MSDVSFNAYHLADLLRKVYFFKSLSREKFDQLVTHMQIVNHKKDDVIMKQGDRGTAFCLIGVGRVSVWVKKDYGKAKVAELLPGQFFGEMALIANEPRSATVIAEENTDMYILKRNDFESILMDDPVAAKELWKVYNERKQKNKKD